MGQSTDANLYYGIQLEDGIDLPWDDWEEYYAMKMGLLSIEEEYNDETQEIYREYWRKKQELVEKSDCSVKSHCSCDYPMYYVCINESEIRGCPMTVKSLEVGPNWDEKLKRFCEIMGLEYEQPQWWLSSMWC